MTHLFCAVITLALGVVAAFVLKVNRRSKENERQLNNLRYDIVLKLHQPGHKPVPPSPHTKNHLTLIPGGLAAIGTALAAAAHWANEMYRAQRPTALATAATTTLTTAAAVATLSIAPLQPKEAPPSDLPPAPTAPDTEPEADEHALPDTAPVGAAPKTTGERPATDKDKKKEPAPSATPTPTPEPTTAPAPAAGPATTGQSGASTAPSNDKHRDSPRPDLPRPEEKADDSHGPSDTSQTDARPGRSGKRGRGLGGNPPGHDSHPERPGKGTERRGKA
ncbi:hypothetical protein RM572_00830 [Streptomyces sp. DSM 42041]|uniref:Translation initiation factor IF-2 n=1 Tax=Streptomyces hazeniae TaxID=3075538 RepID=A0ABU2NKM4_9ACTN|nr:hypothetical protein [Streptomyces sp. DSM 42041]MDT0377320.1 hypothetical protein [Streptomyces sp. DSM 42041]